MAFVESLDPRDLGTFLYVWQGTLPIERDVRRPLFLELNKAHV